MHSLHHGSSHTANLLRRPMLKKPVTVLVAGAVLAVSTPVPTAQAELIPTDRIVQSTQVEQARSDLAAFMARDDVRAQMQALGVSPEEAEARINALSDDEVAAIKDRLDTLPAGEGVGAVVAGVVIVFLVLLVTDILGLTDVFPFTKKGSANPG